MSIQIWGNDSYDLFHKKELAGSGILHLQSARAVASPRQRDESDPPLASSVSQVGLEELQTVVIRFAVW